MSDIENVSEADEVSEKPNIRHKGSPHIAVLLYPDNEEHQNALITIHKKFDYTYILHDKDVFEDSEDELQKKPHIHCLLHFSSDRTPNGIAKILQIETRFVQRVTNRDAFLRYLIHLDDKDKYQYSIDEVVSNRRLLIVDAVRRSRTETERAKEIIQIIQYKNFVDYVEFWEFLVDNGYFPEAKKCTYLIRDWWKVYCNRHHQMPVI